MRTIAPVLAVLLCLLPCSTSAVYADGWKWPAWNPFSPSKPASRGYYTPRMSGKAVQGPVTTPAKKQSPDESASMLDRLSQGTTKAFTGAFDMLTLKPLRSAGKNKKQDRPRIVSSWSGQFHSQRPASAAQPKSFLEDLFPASNDPPPVKTTAW